MNWRRAIVAIAAVSALFAWGCGGNIGESHYANGGTVHISGSFAVSTGKGHSSAVRKDIFRSSGLISNGGTLGSGNDVMEPFCGASVSNLQDLANVGITIITDSNGGSYSTLCSGNAGSAGCMVFSVTGPDNSGNCTISVNGTLPSHNAVVAAQSIHIVGTIGASFTTGVDAANITTDPDLFESVTLTSFENNGVSIVQMPADVAGVEAITDDGTSSDPTLMTLAFTPPDWLSTYDSVSSSGFNMVYTFSSAGSDTPVAGQITQSFPIIISLAPTGVGSDVALPQGNLQATFLFCDLNTASAHCMITRGTSDLTADLSDASGNWIDSAGTSTGVLGQDVEVDFHEAMIAAFNEDGTPSAGSTVDSDSVQVSCQSTECPGTLNYSLVCVTDPVTQVCEQDKIEFVFDDPDAIADDLMEVTITSQALNLAYESAQQETITYYNAWSAGDEFYRDSLAASDSPYTFLNNYLIPAAGLPLDFTQYDSSLFQVSNNAVTISDVNYEMGKAYFPAKELEVISSAASFEIDLSNLAGFDHVDGDLTDAISVAVFDSADKDGKERLYIAGLRVGSMLINGNPSGPILLEAAMVWSYDPTQQSPQWALEEFTRRPAPAEATDFRLQIFYDNVEGALTPYIDDGSGWTDMTSSSFSAAPGLGSAWPAQFNDPHYVGFLVTFSDTDPLGHSSVNLTKITNLGVKSADELNKPLMHSSQSASPP